MSILDDAIREHLELKRQHGAPDDEVKKLEDEAFGPPARPDGLADPLAEAPTEFMTAPDLPAESAAFDDEEPPTEIAEPEGRRAPDIADLQEAPPAPEPAAETSPEPVAEDEPEPPAEEPHPAMEHETIPEPPPAPPEPEASHTTEERHAIAEQPTEMFDVESELAGDAGEELPAAEAAAPSDEELLETELEEPRLAGDAPPADAFVPPAPPAEPTAAPAFDDEDDFFDEQRLSDELDQALEAPAPVAPAEPEATEEHPLPPAEEPVSEEHSPFEPREEGHEDVLEDTPDFLEEAPEDDQLWFEQKPPKDFDFDD